MKSREMVRAYHDDYHRRQFHTLQSRHGHAAIDVKLQAFRPIIQQLGNLMNYLEDLERHDGQHAQITMDIQETKRIHIEKYCKMIDELCGNVHTAMKNCFTQDLDWEHLDCDMELFHRMDVDVRRCVHVESYRVDCLVEVLKFHNQAPDQLFTVYNDRQLYKVLELISRNGNVHSLETIRYNETLPTKVLHYYLSRECRTVCLNWQKRKWLKVRAVERYIKMVSRKYRGEPAVWEYVVFLKRCLVHFITCGHLSRINRCEKLVPPFIKHILTHHTSFKSTHHVPYVDMYRILVNSATLESTENSIFTNTEVSPMQIHKYYQTGLVYYVGGQDELMDVVVDRLLWGQTLPIDQMVSYLNAKYGYYNNDLYLEKFDDFVNELKEVVDRSIRQMLLSNHAIFTQHFPFLPYLLDHFTTKPPPHQGITWREDGSHHQWLLSLRTYLMERLE